MRVRRECKVRGVASLRMVTDVIGGAFAEVPACV